MNQELYLFRSYVLVVLVTSVAIIASCGDQGAEADQPARLFTTSANPGGGEIFCFAVNVSGKTLSEITIKLVQAITGSFTHQTCSNVKSQQACILSFNTNVPHYCIIEVMGNEKETVRGSLTIQNNAGATIISLEAR
ncbi:MAG: hypothetical protein AB1390_03760 [Nitrospirota bacterium]